MKTKNKENRRMKMFKEQNFTLPKEQKIRRKRSKNKREKKENQYHFILA
jgi:hypothetical protein